MAAPEPRVGIESTQPEQLLRAIDEARELVDRHLREDVDIYEDAKEILDRFAQAGDPRTASDFYRCESWPSTAAPFATSSTVSPRPATHQVATWEASTFPACSMMPAFATIGAAATTTTRALAVVGRGLASLGAQLAEPFRDKHPDEGPDTGHGNDFECQARERGAHVEEPELSRSTRGRAPIRR